MPTLRSHSGASAAFPLLSRDRPEIVHPSIPGRSPAHPGSDTKFSGVLTGVRFAPLLPDRLSGEGNVLRMRARQRLCDGSCIDRRFWRRDSNGSRNEVHNGGSGHMADRADRRGGIAAAREESAGLAPVRRIVLTSLSVNAEGKKEKGERTDLLTKRPS